MWPAPFVPGWLWGILVALTFICVVIGLLGFLLLVVRSPRDNAVDQHRRWYEGGDITREESERLRRQAEKIRRG